MHTSTPIALSTGFLRLGRRSLERTHVGREPRDVGRAVLFRERGHLPLDPVRDDVGDVAVAYLHAMEIRPLVAGRVGSVAVRAARQEQLLAVGYERGRRWRR